MTTLFYPIEGTSRVNVRAGDRLFAVESPDGTLLTPFDPDTRKAVAIAARSARKHRHALHELAR